MMRQRVEREATVLHAQADDNDLEAADLLHSIKTAQPGEDAFLAKL